MVKLVKKYGEADPIYLIERGDVTQDAVDMTEVGRRHFELSKELNL